MPSVLRVIPPCPGNLGVTVGNRSPTPHLPQLRELYSDAPHIAYIVAPQLTRFYAAGKGTTAHLLPLIKYSKSTLTTLSIMPDLDAGNTEQLLAKTPEVTRLDVNFSDTQFREATTMLGLDFSCVIAVDQSVAVEVIESWWRFVGRMALLEQNGQELVDAAKAWSEIQWLLGASCLAFMVSSLLH
ncbi:hypothetical protein C8R47DRAFT_1223366 [Mycena vitilis]|nr:hypothetical protein C8R47DRAFT_1223366 [Mycena vitilis]